MPTGPVEEPSNTIYVPPTVAATVSIDTVDGLGQTATSFSGTVSTAAGGGYVELYARSVNPTSGQYGQAEELASQQLFTQGSGEQTYNWSIANVDTSSLGNGIYDIEAFFVQPTFYQNLTYYSVSDHPAFTYENVAPGDAQSTPPIAPNPNQTIINLPNENEAVFPNSLPGSSFEISQDGRYLVYTRSGDTYERDLQTGGEIDLTNPSTGIASTPPKGVFDPGQSIDSSAIAYDPSGSGNLEFAYTHTFTSDNGAYTYSAIGDDHPYAVPGEQPYDFSQYYTGYDADLFPVVTDNVTNSATGAVAGSSTILAGFGHNHFEEGIPIGASADGNAVLTENDILNGLGDVGSGSGLGFVTYLTAAPTLTINAVNGTGSLDDFANDTPTTITGTSNAIGQQVEIDIGPAQNTFAPQTEYGSGTEIGTATVQADGTWSLTFDPNAANLTAGYNNSVFIEASVMSAPGTPAQTSETATIDPLAPTVTAIGQGLSGPGNVLNPSEYLTVALTTSKPVFVTGTPTLTLSNGAVATYLNGSGTDFLQFTYTPAIADGNGDLKVTGVGSTPGASILDTNGNPLVYGLGTQDLGVDVDTAPTISGVSPSMNGMVTNSRTVDITGASALTEKVTVTVTDQAGNVVDTVTEATPNTDYFDDRVTVPADGTYSVTATEADGAGGQSPVSAPFDFTVDTVPPAEQITNLKVNSNNTVSLTDQAALNVTITGTLSSPLQAGETVMVGLPGGQGAQATANTGDTSFSLTLPSYLAADFGVGGSVSAYVEDEAGNLGATTTQAFTAAANRTISLVTADPSSPSQASGANPSISGDGRYIAFTGASRGQVSIGGGGGGGSVTAGVYIDTLSTGTVTLAAAGGGDASLSNDGSTLAFDRFDNGHSYNIYVTNLNTNVTTLVSADDGNPAQDGNSASENPSLSADGTEVAFTSYATDLVSGAGGDSQIYVAKLSGGQVTGISVASAPDPTSGLSQGNGYSSGAHISADGDTVAFTSTATDLVNGVIPPGSSEVYVKSLTNDAATGLSAGQAALVSAAADGTIGDNSSSGASISANGRYVAFASNADNLAPDNLAQGATLSPGDTQIYIKDLLTGNVSLVSQTTAGVIGNGSATAPVISADGNTVLFSDSASNLVSGVTGTQLYAATLKDGAVTSLSAVSEPGAIPGNGVSTAASLSGDGSTVAFQSYASNLAASANAGNFSQNVFVTPVGTSGNAVDGYIVGATVGYSNGANGIDSTQPTTTTGPSGAFTLSPGTGPLALSGGVDSATGLAFTGTMEAPIGSTIISPLTTLVEKVAAASGDDTSAGGIAAANVLVDTALDLPTTIDLTTLDPEGAFLNPLSTADQLYDASGAYQAGSELESAEKLIDAAGGSSLSALGAVALKIAENQTIDLADPSQLVAYAGLTAAAATAVTDIVTATTIALDTQLDDLTTAQSMFDAINGAAIALQSGATTALANAALAGTSTAFATVDTDFVNSLPQTLVTDDALAAADSIACYCRGTLIMTDGGELPVEELTIGDQVMTGSGDYRPIKWIGRRGYAGRFVYANPDILPICFKAEALGDGLPLRDLFVSPQHAMFLDGVLIPAEYLVNGVSVIRIDQMDTVDYFHIELESHDVIMAEGAWSETFVDDQGRGIFHNAAEYAALYPHDARVPALYCAPRAEGGYVVEAVRARIAARAGVTAPAQRQGALRGFVDLVRDGRIGGWAQDPASPDAAVRLRIRDNGVTIGEVVADKHRVDLARAGIGTGRYGFEFIVPGGLSPFVRHVIRVECAATGAELPDSSRTIEIKEKAPKTTLSLTANGDAETICQGALDVATRDQISGWAWDPENPSAPVALRIFDNGQPIARILANWHRPDLKAAGIGNGRHSFDLRIPGGLSPRMRHVIEVRRESDGAILTGSPKIIEAASQFDASLEQLVTSAVAAISDEADRARVLSFLVEQSDRLLQQRAETDGGLAERRAYQQFRRRWGASNDPAGVNEPGLRALVIDDRAPVATRDAGSQAILSHMRSLQRLGYDVSFVAASDMAPSADLTDAGITVCDAPFYASVEDVLRRQGDCVDLVYLHRAEIAAGYLALARRHLPRARILYSVADLHHIRLGRQATVENRPELLSAASRLRVTECTAAWSADAVITHSVDELDVLRQAVPAANVHHVPWSLPARETTVPFAARGGIAFIGGYQHTPNVDAACWLVETVMPLVWRTHPEIQCLLVGSAMPPVVRRLERPSVTVLGQVDDLRSSVFDRVRLTVAPLRYGAGVNGKVLESFAAGIPCVMSGIAAEGLTLPPLLQRWVGADAMELAASICKLHDDRVVNRTTARAGLSMIRRNHADATIDAAMQGAIGLQAPASFTHVAALAM